MQGGASTSGGGGASTSGGGGGLIATGGSSTAGAEGDVTIDGESGDVGGRRRRAVASAAASQQLVPPGRSPSRPRTGTEETRARAPRAGWHQRVQHGHRNRSYHHPIARRRGRRRHERRHCVELGRHQRRRQRLRGDWRLRECEFHRGLHGHGHGHGRDAQLGGGHGHDDVRHREGRTATTPAPDGPLGRWMGRYRGVGVTNCGLRRRQHAESGGRPLRRDKHTASAEDSFGAGWEGWACAAGEGDAPSMFPEDSWRRRRQRERLH